MQIGEVASFQNGYAFKSKDFVQDGKYKIIKIKELKDGKVRFFNDSASVNVDDERIIEKYIAEKGDVLFALTGDPVNKNNPLSWVGRVSVYEDDQLALLNQRVCKLVPKEGLNAKYIYYYFRVFDNFYALASIAKGSASQANISTKDIEAMEIALPSLNIQNKIVSVLDSIEEKINQNNKINKNLLEQVLTLYRNKFVDTANNERAICRADEYFDISIGKTPPRKEPQWFSTNPQDVTWVSISDMGTCGLYISSSSEQLTKQAVERHNVKVVPDNTVLLSFKLTVGRIAITNGEMTTNEAIAHFKTDKKEINEYLYCYLKCFNYQTMGSTSSIATAVNSKIIKGMPFVVPTNDELEEFHGFAAPMFAKIKANQIEIDNLTALRDTLLPKLMSGELDVSDIDI